MIMVDDFDEVLVVDRRDASVVEPLERTASEPSPPARGDA